MSTRKIIFITGTDTGVGKTLLTALLLHQLRQTGVNALAMKPFCSGNRDDVHLLQSFQPGKLSDNEVNPFHFLQPLAPLVAAEKESKKISLDQVVKRISKVQKRCDQLLVEGAGGLMVPLGKHYNVADLIGQLDCRIVVVAHNQLGTINHTLLTLHALKSIGKKDNELAVVLMNTGKSDLSARTNHRIIESLASPISIFNLPWLGNNLFSAEKIAKKSRMTQEKLVDLLKIIA